MDIRDAVAGDAEEACTVLRRSIAELCDADHRNDPGILARWLDNKTPDNVSVWIARADASMLVAVERGAILAVGMVTDAGEIILNYVSPDARFRGASRAVLAALEARAQSAAPNNAVSRAPKPHTAFTAPAVTSRTERPPKNSACLRAIEWRRVCDRGGLELFRLR
jgi:hypothetical protein